MYEGARHRRWQRAGFVMCSYLYGSMYPAPSNPWVRDTQEPLRKASFERTTYDNAGDQFNHLNRSGGIQIHTYLAGRPQCRKSARQQLWCLYALMGLRMRGCLIKRVMGYAHHVIGKTNNHLRRWHTSVAPPGVDQYKQCFLIAEISVGSPQQLFHFILKINVFGLKYPQFPFFPSLGNKSTDYKLAIAISWSCRR